ncbi:hypothetical protein V2J09_009353 [Rumex salicifolius]
MKNKLVLEKMEVLPVMIVIFVLVCFRCDAATDPQEVMSLQEMYRALNFSPQLVGWKAKNGDPCGEPWTGISCSGSSVLNMDVSGNSITGEIPVSLPPNASHMNLSHNMLSGPMGNVFTGLPSLREMDLSYNNFTGDLPDSVSSLKNLTKLYLQNNSFTGSVILLADLQLTDLIGGNNFHTLANYPPWKFPLDNVTAGQNISSYPIAESNAIENYPPLKIHMHKKKALGPGGIVVLVGGIALLTTCTAFIIGFHINQARKRQHEDNASTDSSLVSPQISSNRDYPTAPPTGSPHTFTIDLPPLPITMPKRLPPVSHITGRASRRSFSRKCKMPPSAKLYSISELQLATNNFSQENFLGEGSLGSVHRGEFPEGQVFAVKNVNTISLSLHEEEQFLDTIRAASRLRHPNIVRLTGYCIERGQHFLLYEYVRNLTLDDALHCEYFMPLTWGLRLQIAFGIAQALDYMHSMTPPIGHCNLKATNVLLDDDLTPRLCDCGLTGLRPLTSNNVKLKASEIAISNSGYIAPEQGLAGTENTKTDVYAFGVLLLELFTGRRPIDSSRPGEEHCLATWASSQLHNADALADMVDSRIKISPRALSHFADVVSQCIQPEKEFRPSISHIVEDIAQHLLKSGTGVSDGDALEKSFRSTHTRFPGSPTISHLSA